MGGKYYYRPKRSFGQGNIFTGVCLSTGGGACSKFSGGRGGIFWGGVPAPNFRGGVFFRGGCLLQIFGGVPAPNFRGGYFSGGYFWGGGVPAPNFRGGALHRNTVNVRPVRILLECILVTIILMHAMMFCKYGMVYIYNSKRSIKIN